MPQPPVTQDRRTAWCRGAAADHDRTDPRRAQALRRALDEALFRAIHREVARAIG